MMLASEPMEVKRRYVGKINGSYGRCYHTKQNLCDFNKLTCEEMIRDTIKMVVNGNSRESCSIVC